MLRFSHQYCVGGDGSAPFSSVRGLYPTAIGQLMFYTDRFARDPGGTSDSGEPILTSLAIGCSKGDV